MNFCMYLLLQAYGLESGYVVGKSVCTHQYFRVSDWFVTKDGSLVSNWHLVDTVDHLQEVNVVFRTNTIY